MPQQQQQQQQLQPAVHADPPPALVREPRTFSYATGPQLGKGGFAICHRAELLQDSKPTGRVFALKIVKYHMEPTKIAQKFSTELQIHSKLHHSNIVEFYRAFSYEKSTYVVLEICDYGSLADALKKRKFFTMPEIRRFLIQTCGAVKYLHHRNIIHRDLKTGNLFLDKHMNVKVGDFGLAAVLMTRSDIGSRRTTLCGTPNYLAPEILEKGGKGHNEKVDLWAIGIIGYTLAVGRAPFHAAKREDIYKNLQACDYKWPELSKTRNNISSDLQDLVSSLLVHEDDRPNPDQIVSHGFFKTPFIPLELNPEATLKAPKWANMLPPSAETISKGYSDAWYKLCSESGVGEYAPGKCFPLIGGRKIRSVVRDCEKELAFGMQPEVPLRVGTVYVPFPVRENWSSCSTTGLSEIAEEKEPSAEGRALTETQANDRTQKRPITSVRTVSRKENCEPNETVSAYKPNLGRPRRTASSRKIMKTETMPVSQKPAKTFGGIQRARTTRANAATVSQDHHAGSSSPSKHSHQESSTRISQKTVGGETTSKISGDAVTAERDQTIPGSDPVAVLDRVTNFRDNIARALAKKVTGQMQQSQRPDLPFVSKWVDYSRKHGVGYALEDGSVGMTLNAVENHPVAHMIVRSGYYHLRRATLDASTLEKVPFEYYVDKGNLGIEAAPVDDDRKQFLLLLWCKFANYMCQQLGQNETGELEDDAKGLKPRPFVRFYQRLGDLGIWGFGDGSFQFNFPDHTKLVMSADGIHCNFTCLSVEAAQYLRQNGGELPFKYLRDRHILSSSLRNLIHGSSSGVEPIPFRATTEANILKNKLDFVMRIFGQWVSEGGLGRLTANQPQKPLWKGPGGEEGKKKDWVTVGRQGGDFPSDFNLSSTACLFESWLHALFLIVSLSVYK